ncbi:MAG: PIN domain-containing protein [Chloroflexota bacterium]|nr:PIN domain-containing protein [Chloroflexota bacterium]
MFSAPLRDLLLRSADIGLFRPHWTDDILEEVRRNLVSTGRSTEVQAQRLIQTLQSYFPEALVTGHERLTPTMSNHPKDRHVLAAALISRSQVIVTHNLRDFSEEVLVPLKIRAQSPDGFLLYLYDLAPDVVVQIIIDQASDLRRPPQNMERVLTALEPHAPHFANLISSRVAAPGG